MPLRSRADRTAITSAALLLANLVLAASGTAQSSDWPVQRLHPPSSSLSRLSPADQATALRLLRPELGPLFQGDAPSVIDQQIRSFRAERISLGSVPAVVLAPSAGELCGNNGNCGFWIIDLLHRRVLLRSDSVQAFAVESGKPHATPNVITRTGTPAGQSEITRWHLSGASYERESCATSISTDDSGARLEKPRITPHSCSPEGN
jgi:hypothetical protein